MLWPSGSHDSRTLLGFTSYGNKYSSTGKIQEQRRSTVSNDSRFQNKKARCNGVTFKPALRKQSQEDL